MFTKLRSNLGLFANQGGLTTAGKVGVAAAGIAIGGGIGMSIQRKRNWNEHKSRARKAVGEMSDAQLMKYKDYEFLHGEGSLTHNQAINWMRNNPGHWYR